MLKRTTQTIIVMHLAHVHVWNTRGQETLLVVQSCTTIIHYKGCACCTRWLTKITPPLSTIQDKGSLENCTSHTISLSLSLIATTACTAAKEFPWNLSSSTLVHRLAWYRFTGQVIHGFIWPHYNNVCSYTWPGSGEFPPNPPSSLPSFLLTKFDPYSMCIIHLKNPLCPLFENLGEIASHPLPPSLLDQILLSLSPLPLSCQPCCMLHPLVGVLGRYIAPVGCEIIGSLALSKK